MAAKTSIAEAYVQIIPSAEGIKNNISKILNKEGSGAGTSFGNSIANFAKKAIAGAGIGKFFQSAIFEEGANLEQSIGGIETLFEDSKNTMLAYADKAFETAGLSANEYMQTVTSFSASLLQGLGGDTAKAAEIADMAIIDMSDNANKMGTDMSAIQVAYQGFAKQNYTMLDNLKLGYGGTKTEMERLLKDATALSGVQYDISNLADVYEAIHVIQEDLHITGTTAKEASSTITGSLNAMKSAWKNVLGKMALGQDIKPALNSLVLTAKTFLVNNLLPAVVNVAKAVPGALATALPTIGTELMTLITTYDWGRLITNIYQRLEMEMKIHIPKMIQSGMEAITNFGLGLMQNLPALITNAGEILNRLLGALMSGSTKILGAGAEMIHQLVSGFMVNFPSIVSAAAEIIGQLIATFIQRLPEILQTGIRIISELLMGLLAAVPSLIAGIPQIVASIVKAFTGKDWKTVGGDIVKGIANGIKNGATAIVNAAKEVAHKALDAAKNFLGIHSPSKVMRDQVGMMISAGMAEGITGNAKTVQNAMNEVNGMLTAQPSLIRAGMSSYGRYAADGMQASMGGGFTQNITVNAPTELSPSEIARQTRNATRQMALSMSGVI